MNKIIFKWILIITTIFIFLYAFSSSYSSRNIDHLDYVVALGIDSADDPNMINVTFEFIDVSSFSNNSSSEETSPILNTITATSIDSAINIMNAYAGKEINLSTCKVVVFSEKVAKRGIFSEISNLMNNAQVRPSVNVIIATDNSKDYIENSTSSLEKILTKYYEIFPNSSKYTGYTSNITIGKFYESLKNPHTGNIAILGGTNEASTKNKQDSRKSNNSSASSQESSNNSSPENSSSQNSMQNTTSTSQENQNTASENTSSSTTVQNMIAGNSSIIGERGTENIGLAVFKSDKYIGDLTALETLCHSIIINEADSFLISIPDPFGSENLIDLSISKDSNCDIDIDTSKDHPVININVSLTGRLSSVVKDLNYNDQSTLDTIQSATEDYLKAQISDYLYKTSKDLKVDIDEFYDILKKKFLSTTDLNAFNWEDKYENAEFNINVDADIISSLLVQND